mmetsp:Transcript_27088/g.62976  ORF Transcript_27088/g.62976 Transcript_27088/m.62976 type:complete len:249 (-) Transcript_27088:914-1660(-)
MDLLRLHIFDCRCLGILAGLLQPQKDAIPELHTRQGAHAHKEEHTIQDWHRKKLQERQSKERQTHQQMREEHCEARFLHMSDLAVTVLLGEGIQVDDAGNSGRNQPRKTKHTIDHVENSTQQKIVVVRLSMLEVVRLVVHKMPCDSVVKEHQEECEEGWTSRHERNPSLPVQFEKVNKPWTDTRRCGLFRTVLGEEGLATAVATLKSWLEFVRHIELFCLDPAEQKLLHKCGNQNRNRDGKVMDRSAN